MRVGTGSFRWVAAGAALTSLLVVTLLAGCGGGSTQQDGITAATDTATSFLDALGNQDVAALRSLMSAEYLAANDVPDPITREQLIDALGYVTAYRFIPDEDITIDGSRAVVTVDIEVAGKGVREETLVLSLQGEEWMVDDFTAMDWSQQPVVQDAENVEVEQALRDFLIACIDGDTAYVFDHLSPGYKEKHRLEEPWTPAEFSGVFGTARSYDFVPEDIDSEDGTAEVDVTVEFGTRGNLESETTRVVLVQEGKNWFVDVFPFFIY
ncbi:MAG: nuclear transport factor 2 family protein [Actinobacteria bacterium]|jgi:hypothetical protein|nr:MAG: nuclear transport factor 2 family protein [Actinomycetota bacterium]